MSQGDNSCLGVCQDCGKIRLADAWVGLWWHHGVTAVNSPRQDVAQGTWLLLSLSHGVAIGHRIWSSSAPGGACWVYPGGTEVVQLDAHGAPLVAPALPQHPGDLELSEARSPILPRLAPWMIVTIAS